MAISRKMLGKMHDHMNPQQSVIIKFSDTLAGFAALGNLMSNASVRFLNESDRAYAIASFHGECWNERNERSFHVYPGECFLNEMFQIFGAEKGGIESVQCYGSSPLNQLQSGRAKRRNEAMEDIFAQCITDEFRTEVLDFDCVIGNAVCESDGLYEMQIRILDPDGNICICVRLDGWSGNVFMDEIEPFFYDRNGAKEVGKLLTLRFAQYLEEATA